MNLHKAVQTTIAVAWNGGRDWDTKATTMLWKFFKWVEGRGRIHLNLEDVTTITLDHYVTTLGSVGPATVNRHLSVVSKMFGVAKQRGYTGPMPYIPRQKEPPHRVRFLSKREEQRLAAGLIVRLGKSWEIMVLLIDTGMRLSELGRMKPQDVNWTTGMITVPESKSGRPRSIPMTTRVRDILNVDPPKVYYVPDLTIFRKHWNEVREHMTLKGDDAFTPHVLRHTCASRLVQAGVPLKVVQEWLGHSNINMTLRYAHLAPANLENACNALEEYNYDN